MRAPLQGVGIPGVVRRLLTEAKIPVTEQVIYADELARFDEAFLCSTVRGLVPLNRIDQHRMSTPRASSVFRHIERLFLTWVESQLGFRVDWNDEGIMASVSRDGHALMLCERDQGLPGTWVWFGVADAGALHGELAAAGATIRLPPTNYPWAYEFHVEDPDGHVLRFGSEARADLPFAAWVLWYRERTPTGPPVARRSDEPG